MSRAALLGLLAALLAACDDPADPGPRAAYVLITPADTVLAPGDTVRLRATGYDEQDASVVGVEFEWRSLDSTRVSVDSLGLATAREPGVVRIAASDRRSGARGFATLDVRRISGFSPGHGAFGAIVALQGSAFAPDARVWFGDVEAFVRSVREDGRGIEAWVPVGAATAAIRVDNGGGSITTAEPFFVTGGGDDALEPNGFDEPYPVPFPFENPSLVARPVFSERDADLYRFVVPSDGPLKVELMDRSGVTDLLRVTRIELVDVNAQDLLGLVASLAPVRNEPLRPVTISLPHVRAGAYEALVTPFSYTRSFSGILAGDRSYGFRLDREPVFALEPDSLEPNDYPRDASPIEFPADVELHIENPFATDYLSFQLETRTTVLIETGVFAENGQPDLISDIDLFLMSWPTKSVPWVVSRGEFPAVYRASIAPYSFEQILDTFDPGTYILAVIDASGEPVKYRLRLGVAPGPPYADSPVQAQDAAPDKPALWRSATLPTRLPGAPKPASRP